MLRTKLYIEKRKDKTGNLIVKNVPIYLNCSFEGKRLMHYTGERIDANKWDEKNQRVKSSVIGALEINNILEKLADDAKRIYREAIVNNKHSITPSYIRYELTKDHSKNQKLLIDIFQEYIDNKIPSSTLGTIKKYKTNLNNLKAFSAKYKYDLTFDNINEIFFRRYERFFIEDLNHNNNTIAKNMRILKGFLNWAVEKNYNKNIEYKKIKYTEKPGEILALDWDELMILYNTKLPSTCHTQVRDVFCFGCFTGLRFSDLLNLKKNNIRDNTIYITSIKTKDSLSIPLNDYSKEILAKYIDYPTEKCLPVISNQKANEYLKEIGKFVGFNKAIGKVRFKGTERVETNYMFYELLTTHVARKTFVTNAFRSLIPTEVIMKYTGHKSSETLARYNCISDIQKKDFMEKAFSK